jgi:hypothetical protein
MFHSKRRSIPAILAGALGVGGAFAVTPAAFADDAADTQALKEQIRLLQTKIERMETRQEAAQTQPAPRPAQTQAAQPNGTDAVGAAVGGALPDAERRSQPLSLSPQGFTAGYDNGKFLIQSEDGNFVLNPNAQFQFRYVANHRDAAEDDDTDGQLGFEIPRMKLALDGNVFSKNTTYRFQWDTNTTGGNLVLEEAYVRHAFGENFWGGRLRNWAVKAGQFKDPTFHEELTSSKRLLAADRSLLNEVLAGGQTDYEQGVTMIYSPTRPLFGKTAWRAEFGFIDGANTDNTNFTDSGGPATLGVTNASWGAVARVDFKLAGNWKDYDDFTAMRTKDYLAVVGAGLNVTEGDGGTAWFHTVDVQWEPATVVPGLSVYGAYVGVSQDLRGEDAENPYHWGFLAQAGYMLNDQWEVFGRYDYTDLDLEAVGGGNAEDKLHEITVGVNYYMKGHASKITADFTWLPNGSPLDLQGIGVLESGEEDQILFRVQYQLLL